jgi:hypothetical protein
MGECNPANAPGEGDPTYSRKSTTEEVTGIATALGAGVAAGIAAKFVAKFAGPFLGKAWAKVLRSECKTAARAEVNPAKFRYLFGEAGGRAHNVAPRGQHVPIHDRNPIWRTIDELRSVLGS